MEKSAKQRLNNFMNGLARRNPGQSEFHQAVYEVAVDIIPFVILLFLVRLKMKSAEMMPEF